MRRSSSSLPRASSGLTPDAQSVTKTCKLELRGFLSCIELGESRLMRLLLLLSLALGLPAISSAQAQDVAAGEKLFLQCRACHQVGDTAKNAVGPVLNGLFGRKASMVEGFTYSPANKNSGLTWDEAMFREYMQVGGVRGEVQIRCP